MKKTLITIFITVIVTIAAIWLAIGVLYNSLLQARGY